MVIHVEQYSSCKGLLLLESDLESRKLIWLWHLRLSMKTYSVTI